MLSGALTIVAGCKVNWKVRWPLLFAGWDPKELDEFGEIKKEASVSVELGKKKMQNSCASG